MEALLDFVRLQLNVMIRGRERLLGYLQLKPILLLATSKGNLISEKHAKAPRGYKWK